MLWSGLRGTFLGGMRYYVLTIAWISLNDRSSGGRHRIHALTVQGSSIQNTYSVVIYIYVHPGTE